MKLVAPTLMQRVAMNLKFRIAIYKGNRTAIKIINY